MNQTLLFDALQFDETDLLANQQGQLSTRQKDKLNVKAFQAIALYGLLILILIGSLLIPAIRDYITSSNINNLFPVLFFTILPIIFATSLAITIMNIAKDLNSGEVRSISGTVFLSYTGKSPRRTLNIGDKRIWIPDISSEAIESNAEYIVYYTQKSNTFLSIAKLE
jgi:ribose/xylose/arabinose/galactoside ABC-type transport system permease subunit